MLIDKQKFTFNDNISPHKTQIFNLRYVLRLFITPDNL